VQVAKGLLALHFEKPDRVDPPPGAYDPESLRDQAAHAQRYGAEAARLALESLPDTPVITKTAGVDVLASVPCQTALTGALPLLSGADPTPHIAGRSTDSRNR
jgi:hypothetical protein